MNSEGPDSYNDKNQKHLLVVSLVLLPWEPPFYRRLAYVYIQYPYGLYDGQLKTFFSNITTMPVIEAADEIAIAPTIYNTASLYALSKKL